MSLFNGTTPPAPGIYPNIDFETYKSCTAVNASALILIRRLPALLKYREQNPLEPTAAMILGSQVDMYVLEPEVFKVRFVVAPDVDKRTKEGKAEWNEFYDHLEDGQQPISAKDFAKVTAIGESMKKQTTFSTILPEIKESQLSLVWVDTETGLTCKARIDAALTELNAILDLKTTSSASKEDFARSIFDYGYHIQAAQYLSGAKTLGINVDNYLFAVVETSEPYFSAMYELADESIEIGRKERSALLRKLAECRETDKWQGYPDEVQMITIPKWAAMRVLDKPDLPTNQMQEF